MSATLNQRVVGSSPTRPTIKNSVQDAGVAPQWLSGERLLCGTELPWSYLGATVDCLPTSTSVACSPTHPRPSVIGCRFHAPRQATSTVQASDSLTELLLVLQKLLDNVRPTRRVRRAHREPLGDTAHLLHHEARDSRLCAVAATGSRR